MSKLERLNARVTKLLTVAVHEVLEVVKETVSEYQEKTARTQSENESLKRRLRDLQDKLRIDNAGENHLLPGSSNNPSKDKTTKDEIEELDPLTGSSSERKMLQKEIKEEEMIVITVSDTVDCSVSPGLVTDHLSNVTNTDLTGHVAYWLPGEEHDVSVRQMSFTSVSPLCSQTLLPIKAEPEPGYLCSPDQVEQGDTFNCGGLASGVSQRGSSPNNTENPDMANKVQYSDQWKQELEPTNQDAPSFHFIQYYTGEEEKPLDGGGSERLIGPTSNGPAEPEPSEPAWRSPRRVVGRPKSPGDLNRHHSVHTGEKPYCCTVCGKNFSQLYRLKNHQRQHTRKKPYKPYGCTQCDKCFSRPGNLKIHQLQHTVEKPYSCTQCDKSFPNLSNLKIHQGNHTRGKPYSCTQCDKSFADLSNLKIHQGNHTRGKPYSCTQCSKCFSSHGNFQKHKLTHLLQHSVTDLSNLKTVQHHHTGEKPYSCTQCSKRFSYPNCFKKHQLTHLPQDSQGPD